MIANKKTEGAWLIHHSTKLQNISGAIEFQDIEFAGKCGILLSALAADTESTLSRKKVEAMAKAAKLNVHTDLPAILSKLAERQLVDQSPQGLAVLGLSTETVLSHASEIFHSTEPNAEEKAALFLSEETSRAPAVENHLVEKVCDLNSLPAAAVKSLLEKSATIGFVDSQALDSSTRLYFNGNLFRVENGKKFEAVLSSLTQVDRSSMAALEEALLKKGCLEESDARRLLGAVLFDKLQSIGVFDVNGVSNEKETTFYVTRPGAFGKFGNTIAEDAFDLAKALVASLSYGMTKSVHTRGKIRLLNLLLGKLIRGEWLNPNTAAGHDYKILETKGVVEVKPAGRGMFRMRLLKKEVGTQAKNILNFGDTSEDSLPLIPGASVITYTGPEQNRTLKRKRLTEPDKAMTAALLNDIRTGSLQ